MKTHHTFKEIVSQPAAWAQAIELAAATDLPDPADFPQVLFTGCGSTYYLSLAAAALYQELTHRPARAIPASELLLNPAVALRDDVSHLLVAISRSGTTTETVKAVRKFRKDKRGQVLAITNYPTDLSEQADTAIIIDQGQEKSVAQTRSFASMFVAVTALCARMAGHADLLAAMHALPDIGKRLIKKYEPFARQLGANLDLDRFYFLGSGYRYGLASEASLKLKEMTLTHCEPFYFLEFRHGPMAMVGKSAAVLGLLSDSNHAHEARVLAEMRGLGATTIALGEDGPEVEFDSGIPEAVRGVLYLPVLQLMAYHRSLAKGLNPDRPENLTAVVKLDL